MKEKTLIAPYAANPAIPSIQLGGILLQEKLIKNSPVNLVLKSFNRHGLIAGATGSGKTKTMQVLCEQLSLRGIPSLVMDIKGDVSGLALPGENSEALIKRSQSLDLDFKPQGFPVELLTLNEASEGLPLRATLQDFGSLLFSRMLDLNDTQSGVVSVLFEYAKEAALPLIDLQDMRELLCFVQTNGGKQAIESRFGSVATSTVGTITRKIIDLEAQGGGNFFGQPAFQVMDLVRTNTSGQGIISILRLMDMQDKPKLFSTFMLKLLSDIYRQFPELGDPEEPKLVIFIDEAHLIFKNASKALSDLLETMIKLIRSKGVGIFFCTQLPTDIPDAVLSQLGLKIQHALRAFTAKDRTAMKLVAQNFPPSTFYNTENLLTSLGIGEALISALDENGQPTPLIQCLIRAPESRMGTLNATELQHILAQSRLYPHYAKKQHTESAKDILAKNAPNQSHSEESVESSTKPTKESNMVTILSKNTLFRQIIRQFFRQLTKTFLDLLGKKR